MPKTIISGADYQRIFRVVYSVLEPDLRDPEHGCFYINILAAALLREYYHIPAIPVVGAAAYCLNGKANSILLYASLKDDTLDVDGPNVHCWIKADDWHIDFMAPLFPMLAKKGGLPVCKSKMMCKPINAAKMSLADLKQDGDYFILPNLERTREEISRLISKPLVSDLSHISSMWFERPPAKMKEAIEIGKSDDSRYPVHLTKLRIEGSW